MMPTSSREGNPTWGGRSAGDRLDSWKDIASYFKRDVRTIQRWEKSLGLPIHRFQNSRSGPVFAYKAELELWLGERKKQPDAVLAQENNPTSATIIPSGESAALRSDTHRTGECKIQQSPQNDIQATDRDSYPPLLNGEAPQNEKSLRSCETSDNIAPVSLPAPVPDIEFRKRWRGISAALIAGLILGGVVIGLANSHVRQSLAENRTFRQITTAANENRVTAAALSGDGHKVVFADAQGAIHVQDLDSGYSHILCTIPDGHLSRVAWFPDGAHVLLSGFLKTTQQFSVWTLALKDRQLEILRSGATQAVPSPSGNTIAFLQAAGSEIWTIKVNGSSLQRLVTDANANAFETVVWSSDGHRLSYTRKHAIPRRGPGGDLSMDTPDIECVYETVDARSGKLVVAQPSNGLSLPSPLNDGRVLFVRDDHSSYDLVEVKTDPSTGRFEGKPRSIAVVSRMGVPEVLNATQNGRRVAAVLRKSQQPDVYVGEIEPRTMGLSHVEQLTLNSTQDYPHAWMPDNLSVLFESNRSGDWQIFKQQTRNTDGEPIAFDSKWDVMPQVSPDGRWILYLHNPRFVPVLGQPGSKRVFSLMRVPIDGGQPQQVFGEDAVEEYQCAGPRGKRCVVRSIESGQFVFYDLDPIRGKGRELTRLAARHNIFGDWGLSPDGSFVAIPDHGVPRCVFSLLDLDHPEKRATEFVVDALPALTAVSWASGRPGWFISVPLAAGVELRYVDEKGHSSRVWESAVPTWPIASPDGRRLAFVDGSADSNVWMLDR